jgi:hypothetical protein
VHPPERPPTPPGYGRRGATDDARDSASSHHDNQAADANPTRTNTEVRPSQPAAADGSQAGVGRRARGSRRRTTRQTVGVAGWPDYQEKAATVFRSLGLEVETDTHLDGVRGQHAVDIEVRGRRAGLDQLWVATCQHRRRQVAELHVASLATIVADVGADRGILLSEMSFQAGARGLAYKSDITLTSLVDLRAHAETEVLLVPLDDGRRRLSRVLERRSVLRREEENAGRSEGSRWERRDDVRLRCLDELLRRFVAGQTDLKPSIGNPEPFRPCAFAHAIEQGHQPRHVHAREHLHRPHGRQCRGRSPRRPTMPLAG